LTELILYNIFGVGLEIILHIITERKVIIMYLYLVWYHNIFECQHGNSTVAFELHTILNSLKIFN